MPKAELEIDLTDGTTITYKEGDSGTLENPEAIGGGFEAFNCEEGIGFQAAGLPHHEGNDFFPQFSEVRSSVDPLNTFPGYKDGTLIPKNQGKRQSYYFPQYGRHHFLVPGQERVFVQTKHRERLLAPSFTDPVWRVLDKRIDNETILDEYEGARHLLGLYSDKGAGIDEPDGPGQDLGWMLNHAQKRIGPIPPEEDSWYAGNWPRDGETYSGCNYDEVFWPLLLHFYGPTQSMDTTGAWDLGMRLALQQACVGQYQTGRNAGMFAYEKSSMSGFSGDYFGPATEKQWPRGLILYAYMTKHSLLKHAVKLHLEWLRQKDPVSVWPFGQWGARRMGYYLECLMNAYDVTRDEVYKIKAQTAIAHCFSLLRKMNLTYGVNWWVNDGSPKDTSPWMISNLIGAISKWMLHHGVGREHLAELAATTVATLNVSTFRRPSGAYQTYYRISPYGNHDGDNSHPGTHNASMIPALRVAQNINAHFAQMKKDLTEQVFTTIGWNWKEIDDYYTWGKEAGMVTGPPLSEIGIVDDREGVSGWPKSTRIMLWATHV